MVKPNSSREVPIRFDECTWVELDSLDRANVVLILPIGSTEPHGPHLPLSTDVIISDGMAMRAARRLRERGITALVLPPIAYSVTEFSADFTGAISIGFETAQRVIGDILKGAISHGFRKICVANSHLEPDHIASITSAIRTVESETGTPIAFPDKTRRRWAATLTDEFRSGACHAGQYESSLILADRPDLVRESVRSELEPVDISLSDAIRMGHSTFRAAGGDRAYFGAPADATGGEGSATFDLLGDMLVQSVFETYSFDDAIHDDH